MNPDIPLDPTDDQASVGYNTIPKGSLTVLVLVIKII